MPQREIAKTLIKGIDAVIVLAGNPEGMNVTEVALALHEPRTIAHRLLRTLEIFGMVSCSENRWRIAPHAMEIVMNDRHRRLRRRYRPVLETVAEATGELTLLGLHEGHGIIHIDFISSDGSVRVAPAPVTRHNLRVNALGKLALSRRPDLMEWRDARLRKELEKVVNAGVAWNREESVRGMIALACPGFTNLPADGMIAVAWPKRRFTEEKGRSAVAAIRAALCKGGE